MSLSNIINIFSTREIASLIWVGLFIAYVIIKLPKQIVHIIKLLLNIKIMFSFMVLLLYAFIIGKALLKIDFWNINFTINYISWVLLVAIPISVNAANYKRDYVKINDILLSMIKLTILLEFLINRYTFILPIELFLTGIITFLFIMKILSEHLKDKETRLFAKKFSNISITILGFLLIFKTICGIFTNPQQIDVFSLIVTIILPIIMIIFFLPVFYFFAVYSLLDTIYIRLKIIDFNKTDRVMLFLRIVIHSKLSYEKLKNIYDEMLKKLHKNMSNEDIDLFFEEI